VNEQTGEENEGLRPHIAWAKTPNFVHGYRGISFHQVMAIFRKTEKEVVRGVDRSGLLRAHKLDATVDHYHGKLRWHFLPAHCGHPLNPIEGFWPVMKDTIGAGWCFGDLQQLYQCTRRVLMAHQERAIYAFHW
jgi:hypothetical protein